MDALADNGVVMLGGPLGDGEGEVPAHWRCATSEPVIEVELSDEPWTPLRLLREASVERWEILLPALVVHGQRVQVGGKSGTRKTKEGKQA